MAEAESFNLLNTFRSQAFDVSQSLLALLLRQEKDQKCYDFMDWLLNYFFFSDRPFIEKQLNMLEPLPEKLLTGHYDTAFLISFLIIKLKLHHKIKAFKESFHHFLLGTTKEGTGLSKLRGNYLVLTEIFEFAGDIPIKKSGEKSSYKNLLLSLEEQIETVFVMANRMNPNIWNNLLQPSVFLQAKRTSRNDMKQFFLIRAFTKPFDKLLNEAKESTIFFHQLVYKHRFDRHDSDDDDDYDDNFYDGYDSDDYDYGRYL